MSFAEYIGCMIELTTNSRCRYEGLLKDIQTDSGEGTVTLEKVFIRGTEGRLGGVNEIPRSETLHATILFKANDITELNVSGDDALAIYNRELAAFEATQRPAGFPAAPPQQPAPQQSNFGGNNNNGGFSQGGYNQNRNQDYNNQNQGYNNNYQGNQGGYNGPSRGGFRGGRGGFNGPQQFHNRQQGYNQNQNQGGYNNQNQNQDRYHQNQGGNQGGYNNQNQNRYNNNNNNNNDGGYNNQNNNQVQGGFRGGRGGFRGGRGGFQGGAPRQNFNQGGYNNQNQNQNQNGPHGMVPHTYRAPYNNQNQGGGYQGNRPYNQGPRQYNNNQNNNQNRDAHHQSSAPRVNLNRHMGGEVGVLEASKDAPLKAQLLTAGDFDFASAPADFKQDIVAAKDGQHAYEAKSSFFDQLSCEAITGPKPHEDRQRIRAVDEDTFGQGAAQHRHFDPRRRRGQGFRGGRGGQGFRGGRGGFRHNQGNNQQGGGEGGYAPPSGFAQQN